jgi:hypothetical protein
VASATRDGATISVARDRDAANDRPERFIAGNLLASTWRYASS